jgi:hypothetical protein
MTSSGPRGKNKGQQGYKQKRMMKRVMEAFIKKHCLQEGPYIIELEVILNSYCYIRLFYYSFC